MVKKCSYANIHLQLNRNLPKRLLSAVAWLKSLVKARNPIIWGCFDELYRETGIEGLKTLSYVVGFFASNF